MARLSAGIDRGGFLLCSRPSSTGGLRRPVRTADGFDKETAVSRAQLALDEYVKQYKAEKKLGAVTLSAMRAAPQPYWRGSVSENMMYKPDIVTSKSYTVCWQGVVSSYVCTSGAKACW